MSSLRKNKKLKDLNVTRGASETFDQAVYSRTARRISERRNNELRQRLQFLVGVDEAGRGPLAGPVAVGVAVIPQHFSWESIPGVNDSKKLTPRERERIYMLARALKREQKIDYAVALVSASRIDRIGITGAVRLCIQRCFTKLSLDPEHCTVKLDGLLKAPAEFLCQETIIRGDAKEKTIGLASILAKVTRDRLMVRQAKKFPQYVFEAHKGYGTELHCEAIRKHGFSPLHRLTFCRRFSGEKKATQN
jgi:ribonuclease HII